MNDYSISVVIPTYNRPQLLGRAIQSALDQNWPQLEVIVVDDASTDNIEEVITRLYPGVRYFRQNANSGQCVARNRGLSEASNDWVIFLDDDDELLPDALRLITERIAGLGSPEKYPIFQFAHGSGSIPAEFMNICLEHYMRGVIRGDFLPVFHKDRCAAIGIEYPEGVRAGEVLLWWKAAGEYGIPTWAERVARIHSDAQDRTTSTIYQVQRARDFAVFHDRVLSEFGEVLMTRFPKYYGKECMGAAIYWILASQRSVGRARARRALRFRWSLPAVGLWILSFLPIVCAREFFKFYKRSSASQA